MAVIEHHSIAVNGVTLHVAEAGDGPPVVLLHGVPELWYSWRHQFLALAEGGYRALAPDIRGCGGSSAPDAVADYSMVHLINDVVGLLDHLGVDSVVLVGHDWGAETVWQCAKAHPERVSALAALSVPYSPRAPEQPSALLERFSHGRFSFVRYFQQPQLAEAEMRADPRRFFRLFLYGLSGDAPPDLLHTLYLHRSPDAGLLDGIPEPAGPLDGSPTPTSTTSPPNMPAPGSPGRSAGTRTSTATGRSSPRSTTQPLTSRRCSLAASATAPSSSVISAPPGPCLTCTIWCSCQAVGIGSNRNAPPR